MNEAWTDPLLRVVRGDPTPEELVALVTAVLTARRATVGDTGSSVGDWRAWHDPGWSRCQAHAPQRHAPRPVVVSGCGEDRGT